MSTAALLYNTTNSRGWTLSESQEIESALEVAPKIDSLIRATILGLICKQIQSSKATEGHQILEEIYKKNVDQNMLRYISGAKYLELEGYIVAPKYTHIFRRMCHQNLDEVPITVEELQKACYTFEHGISGEKDLILEKKISYPYSVWNGLERDNASIYARLLAHKIIAETSRDDLKKQTLAEETLLFARECNCQYKKILQENVPIIRIMPHLL